MTLTTILRLLILIAGWGCLAATPNCGSPTATNDDPAETQETEESEPTVPAMTYPIVDTGQTLCYGRTGTTMLAPAPGEALYGQDAQYVGNAPSYTDNGDGTVTDNVTGLMWQQTPGPKVSWDDAVAGATSLTLAGYSDWRLPSIKELYSLINFSGYTGRTEATSRPYLDTAYFDFEYGNTATGERFIDCQNWSATEYVSTTMVGDATVFGVNFADGRIKGYPKTQRPAMTDKLLFARYVRGNPDYGINAFTDNGDGTITDATTGLMWMRDDSGHLGAGTHGDGSLDWESALAWAEELSYAGHDDWRLPSIKELQSIVDYTRSPATTGSAAIAPVFNVTSIVDEGGGLNFPFYWSSTSHLEGTPPYGHSACYVAFGEALGWMQSPPGSRTYILMDVHGAGAQRSDPKLGDPADYPYGFGPQGDVRRIYNHVRCVRDATS